MKKTLTLCCLARAARGFASTPNPAPTPMAGRHPNRRPWRLLRALLLLASLAIGDAHVALAGQGPAIAPGSDRALTFGGSTRVIIPPGGAGAPRPR